MSSLVHIQVRFTIGADVHYPFLLAPYLLLDEGQGFIDWQAKNEKGVMVHDFGPHERRRLWNYHFFGRSLEALAWKGVRQTLDDTGGGNVRSSQSMLGTIKGMNARDVSPQSHIGVVRDGSAWEYGREFMLTMLIGPRTALNEDRSIGCNSSFCIDSQFHAR